MVYEPGRLRQKSKDIVNARNWGIGIITTLLGIGFFISEIKRIQALHFDPMDYAYIALLLLTGIFIFLWIWATQKELDLLFDWLDPEYYAPPSSIRETILILFYGLALTALLFSSRDPMLYGIVFSVYSATLIPCTIYFKKEVARAVDRSKLRIDCDLNSPDIANKARLYLAGVDVLKGYFLDRPMIWRHWAILGVSIFGVVIAIYWKLSGNKFAGTVSYGIFFIVILLSEVVIARWRCIRDDRLRQIQGDLDECSRNEHSR